MIPREVVAARYDRAARRYGRLLARSQRIEEELGGLRLACVQALEVTPGRAVTTRGGAWGLAPAEGMAALVWTPGEE